MTISENFQQPIEEGKKVFWKPNVSAACIHRPVKKEL
jgi:hypothetical protein